MTKSFFQFNFSELNLKVSQIESIIGYKEGDSQEIISDLINDILKESEKLCRIKAEYIIFPDIKFHDYNKSVEISHQFFQINKIIYGQLKKSDSVAVFLCTAGEEIGARSRSLMKEGDLLKGFIFDIVGSEIVETAAELMQEALGAQSSTVGKRITNRYSPGYCGWDVAEQFKLFQLVPENVCGIRLTESALMIPIKSVSGFIGIGENVKLNPYTCDLCDLKDCIYRKKRGQKSAKV
jgi:hypothetical protein